MKATEIQRMQVATATIDGLRIRYASSMGEHKENVLMLSPLPESIFAYSPMWEGLARHFNLLAIDLPGYGHSEARRDLYSARALSGFVTKVIDHFTFTTPHIIGPDIGTPIALFIAAKHPDKIRSLIVSGGACVLPLEAGKLLTEIIAAPDLSGYRGLQSKDVINNALSELKNYVLPDEIRADYISSYEGTRLIDSWELLRAYPVDLADLDKHLDGLKTPVQIIWGQNDPIATAKNATILHDRLPHSKLNIFANAQHYTWEETSADFLNVTLDWIKGGYLNV
jgi:pimeloyl-ACP methyl ester carboxylesterase